MNGSSWPVSAFQPLPRPVVPAHDETLPSYLARLARANRLDAEALRMHLTGAWSKYVPIPVHALALLSGQSTRALKHAIPELVAEQGLPGQATSRRPRPHGDSQLRCTHCSLARGHQDTVCCWSHQEDSVCPRHRRWIGNVHDQTGQHQPSLNDQPKILQANILHRRMIRRYGYETVTAAFSRAKQICHQWHHRLEHDDDFYNLMNRFHSGPWRVTATDPTVHAARYPQIVSLTRLLASPTWHRRCHEHWPKPTDFINEIRRTVAPHFNWNPQGWSRTHDPLIALLLDQQTRDKPNPVRLTILRQTDTTPNP